MKKDVITLKDFKALAAKEGYACRTRRVSFSGLGYGSKRFITLLKDGVKVEFAGGTKEHLELFDKAHPHLREWRNDLRITDGDETLILDT